MRFVQTRDIEETRDRIMGAVSRLAATRHVPTMRAICKASGISSTAVVSWHAQYLATIGKLVAFRSGSGYVYFPTWFVRRAA